MRRLISALLCLALLGAFPALAAAEAGDIAIDAPSAALMETRTGRVLYAKNASERRAPASVTKVMTLLLAAEAVDSGALALTDTITASERAASMGGSQVWLEAGEELSAADIIKCIAVVSANDCAVALAEHLAGSEAAFVGLMNERAEELGLTDTHFTNCTGLFDDSGHYTSALDIAVMSRELLRHEWIREYTTIWTDSIRSGEFGLSNTNKLLRTLPGCTGLKTGWTELAGYCVAASAEREGTEYVAVIMGAESSDARNADAAALIEHAFASYELCGALDAALPPVRVSGGTADSVQPVIDGADFVLLTRSEAASLTRRVELPGSVDAPVAAGQRLGEIVLSSGGAEITRIPLAAGSEVGRLGFSGAMALLLRRLFVPDAA